VGVALLLPKGQKLEPEDWAAGAAAVVGGAAVIEAGGVGEVGARGALGAAVPIVDGAVTPATGVVEVPVVAVVLDEGWWDGYQLLPR